MARINAFDHFAFDYFYHVHARCLLAMPGDLWLVASYIDASLLGHRDRTFYSRNWTHDAAAGKEAEIARGGGGSQKVTNFKKFIIETVRTVASNLSGWLMPRRFKYLAEYLFWRSRKSLEGDLANAHYEKLILQMGGVRR